MMCTRRRLVCGPHALCDHPLGLDPHRLVHEEVQARAVVHPVRAQTEDARVNLEVGADAVRVLDAWACSSVPFATHGDRDSGEPREVVPQPEA